MSIDGVVGCRNCNHKFCMECRRKTNEWGHEENMKYDSNGELIGDSAADGSSSAEAQNTRK